MAFTPIFLKLWLFKTMPLKTILLTGSSGFIGKSLIRFLESQGYVILACPRECLTEGIRFDRDNFEGLFAVIHLAGENLSTGFWTKKKRQAILESREKGTQNLVHFIQTLRCPPKVFISASAIGYYGNRPDEWLTEESLPGDGFLASVCQKWEQASQSLVKSSIRVVWARFGLVLSFNGGILKKLFPLYSRGLGTKIGSGQQWVSWVHLEDALRSIAYILETEKISGPVNVVNPNPVSQETFSKILAKELKATCFLAIPEFFLKMGSKAKELLLSSSRVLPTKLEKNGFIFIHRTIREAFASLLIQKTKM